MLQAVRHDNLPLVRMIVEHQTSEYGTEHILGTMTAWLSLAFESMPIEYAEHFVAHLRKISELSAEDLYGLAVLNGAA
jgi:hemerythrin-like domain-containing protein